MREAQTIHWKGGHDSQLGNEPESTASGIALSGFASATDRGKTTPGTRRDLRESARHSRRRIAVDPLSLFATARSRCRRLPQPLRGPRIRVSWGYAVTAQRWPSVAVATSEKT